MSKPQKTRTKKYHPKNSSVPWALMARLPLSEKHVASIRQEVNYPGLISGPPTLVKQDVKVSSPKALRERECAPAVAAGRTKVSHSSFAVSEK